MSTPREANPYYLGNINVERINKTVSQDKTAGLEVENARLRVAAFRQDNLDIEAQHDLRSAENPARNPTPAHLAPVSPNNGNLALQEYQMQLMLLEQQNKKRLLLKAMEDDRSNVKARKNPGMSLPGRKKKAATLNQALRSSFTPTADLEITLPGGTDQRFREIDQPRKSDVWISDEPRPALESDLGNQHHGPESHLEALIDKLSTRHKSRLPIRSPKRQLDSGITLSSSQAPKTAPISHLSQDQDHDTTSSPLPNCYASNPRLWQLRDNTVLPVRNFEECQGNPGGPVVPEGRLVQRNAHCASEPSMQTFKSLDTHITQPTSLSSTLVSNKVLEQHGIRFSQDPVSIFWTKSSMTPTDFFRLILRTLLSLTSLLHRALALYSALHALMLEASIRHIPTRLPDFHTMEQRAFELLHRHRSIRVRQ